jgi:hypothetical protein
LNNLIKRRLRDSPVEANAEPLLNQLFESGDNPAAFSFGSSLQAVKLLLFQYMRVCTYSERLQELRKEIGPWLFGLERAFSVTTWIMRDVGAS